MAADSKTIDGCGCCTAPGGCHCPIPEVQDPPAPPGTMYCPVCLCLDDIAWTDSSGSSSCTPQHPNDCHTESFPAGSTLGSLDGHDIASVGVGGTGCAVNLHFSCVDDVFYIRLEVFTPDNPTGILIGVGVPVATVVCSPFWVDTGTQTETHGGTTVTYRITIAPGVC